MLTHRVSMKTLNDASVTIRLPMGHIKLDRVNGALRVSIDAPGQDVQIDEAPKDGPIIEHRKPRLPGQS